MHARRSGSWLPSLVGATLALALRAYGAHADRSFDQYATRAWTQADGLPQNSVVAIAQTPEGYLWLGTEAGLVRFDGVKLTTFDRQRQPGLQSSTVLALGVDPAGTLWVGTTAGLHRLGGESLEHVPLAAEGARAPGVSAIAFGGEGQVFVGSDAGFFRLRGGHVERLAVPAVEDQQISAVLAHEGRVFVGTPSGLYTVDGDRLRDVTSSLRLPTREVRSLAALRDGTLVVGGRGAIASVGPSALRLGEAEGLPPEPVTSVLEGAQGDLWFGTDGGGLVRVRNERVELVTTKHGLAEEHVQALFDDRRGGLWIGTSRGGLQRAFAGPAVTFGALHGLVDPDVRAVFATRRGGLLVGTEGGGYFRRSGASFVPGPADSARTVWGFGEDGRGKLFAFTREDGVVALEGDGATATPVAGTEGFRVRSVLFDESGAIEWLGTQGQGVVRRTSEGFRAVFPEVISPGLLVFFLQRDGDHVLAGTRAGLYRIGERGAERVPLSVRSDAAVLHRRVDAQGDTWLATAAGIVWTHGDAVTVIDDRAGFVDGTVYATVEAPIGVIWAATNRGVVRFKRDDAIALAQGRSPRLRTRLFGLADGFRTLESNAGDPGVFVDGAGAIWFATTDGLTRLDPAKVTLSSAPPSPHLETIVLDRESRSPRGPLHFVSGRHDLEIGFTAFEYAAPAAITFAHRLEGLDSAWIDDGFRREASYTDLRPGTYTFHLRACSVDAACAELKAPLDIVVEPRWFERRSVWASLAFGVGLAAWLAARARIRALDGRARALEARVEERTAALRRALAEVQAKDQLLGQDMEEAARFQAIALRVAVDASDLRVGLRSMPAGIVGGDLVDFFELSEGHYRFFVADTTGHGVQAALRTMVLKTEYEALKRREAAPHDLLAALNDVLVANFPDLELRSTAVCGDLLRAPSGSWELRLSNAAAPELLLATAHEVVEVYEPGPFLGMLPGFTFTLKQQTIASGSRLVFFTDGAFEQEGAEGPFGHHRIEALVRAHEGSAQALADAIADAVRAYAKDPRPADDTTVLVLELGGEPRG